MSSNQAGAEVELQCCEFLCALSNSLTMGRIYVNLRVIAMQVLIVLLSINMLITISIKNKLKTVI